MASKVSSNTGGPLRNNDVRWRRTSNAKTILNVKMLQRQSDSSDSESEPDTPSRVSEKPQSVADVASKLMNVMKIRKGSNISDNGCAAKNSKDTECSTKQQDKSVSRQSSWSNKQSVKSLSRQNSWKGVTQGISALLDLQRGTVTKDEQTSYENTYKMAPESGKRFTISTIEQIAENILKEDIAEMEYDNTFAGDMARTLSAKIQSEVKKLNIPRYRIVCQVVLAEMTDQSLESASRCLWDHVTDTYITANYSNKYINATAMIFGIYYE